MKILRLYTNKLYVALRGFFEPVQHCIELDLVFIFVPGVKYISKKFPFIDGRIILSVKAQTALK